MKILALDIGDVHTGAALSDALGIIATPLTTFATYKLVTDLEHLFAREQISTIVIGYPQTMKGTESEQTKKTRVHKENLEKAFPDKKFVWWDERRSSAQAEQFKRSKNAQDKLMSHARAAAVILNGYLEFLRMQNL